MVLKVACLHSHERCFSVTCLVLQELCGERARIQSTMQKLLSTRSNLKKNSQLLLPVEIILLMSCTRRRWYYHHSVQSFESKRSSMRTICSFDHSATTLLLLVSNRVVRKPGSYLRMSTPLVLQCNSIVQRCCEAVV